MIHILAKKIVEFALVNSSIEQCNLEEKQVYYYGTEITISSVLNILIVFVISIVLDDIAEGFLFLLVFISIRQFTGGYHADSYLKCNMIFAACYLVVLTLYHFLPNQHLSWIQIVLLLAETIFLFWFCPIANKSKPIHSNQQRLKCKWIGIVLFLLCSIISSVLMLYGFQWGTLILITLQVIIALAVIAIIKDWREKNECKTKISKGNY